MSKKSNAGRPTVMTKDVLAKLQDAFLMGCTDEEACLNAGIHPASLYRYQEKNPKFCEQKEVWKQNPFLKARRTIFRSLGKPRDAQWYMEHKKSDEFSRRTDVTSKGEKVGIGVDYIHAKD